MAQREASVGAGEMSQSSYPDGLYIENGRLWSGAQLEVSRAIVASYARAWLILLPLLLGLLAGALIAYLGGSGWLTLAAVVAGALPFVLGLPAEARLERRAKEVGASPVLTAGSTDKRARGTMPTTRVEALASAVFWDCALRGQDVSDVLPELRDLAAASDRIGTARRARANPYAPPSAKLRRALRRIENDVAPSCRVLMQRLDATRLTAEEWELLGVTRLPGDDDRSVGILNRHEDSSAEVNSNLLRLGTKKHEKGEEL